ncbi:hypothetical protein [Microbulbifer sp. TYP-18]|uniref:hypothetical protein n=1 Tax=Microbulbifer sp. TYP-18 TaxID=3230024 RepID=UPI0034C5C5BE
MRKVFLLTAMIISFGAQAGTQTGQISGVTVRASDGLHYFTMHGTTTDKPACATNTYWIIKDENSTAGKSQLSVVLTAYASGKTVAVTGSGECTRWGDGEDVNTILLQ